MYDLHCNECEAIYIGKSVRSIKTRLKEYIYTTDKNIKATDFAEHCTVNDHDFIEEDAKILHFQNFSKKLNCLESLEIQNAIRSYKYVVNNHKELEVFNSPLLLISL